MGDGFGLFVFFAKYDQRYFPKLINERKVWGNKFIDNLAADLRIAFPNTKGYSVWNLKYMAKLAATYPAGEFVQQTVAQIPWRHTVKDKHGNVRKECKFRLRKAEP